VQNSFELYGKLSRIQLNNHETIFSLDVISLSINIPVDLAINSLKKRCEHIKVYTSILKKEFITMVEFILISTYYNFSYFTFNHVIYKQNFDTPMGFPLLPDADLIL